MAAFTFGSALERRPPRFGRERAGVETIGEGLKAVEIGGQRLCISDEGGQVGALAAVIDRKCLAEMMQFGSSFACLALEARSFGKGGAACIIDSKAELAHHRATCAPGQQPQRAHLGED